ncbi:hypothetical protein STA3757_06130 [Stanieria sp. NIES-3757]|nr:hypothetical protein STA3757_06130 [Stanieria sp. NIES-3757]
MESNYTLKNETPMDNVNLLRNALKPHLSLGLR